MEDKMKCVEYHVVNKIITLSVANWGITALVVVIGFLSICSFLNQMNIFKLTSPRTFMCEHTTDCLASVEQGSQAGSWRLGTLSPLGLSDWHGHLSVVLGVFLASGTVIVCETGTSYTSSFHKTISSLEQVDSLSWHLEECCSPVPFPVHIAVEHPTFSFRVRANSLVPP